MSTKEIADLDISGSEFISQKKDKTLYDSSPHVLHINSLKALYTVET
jgi:hypothetical protein